VSQYEYYRDDLYIILVAGSRDWDDAEAIRRELVRAKEKAAHRQMIVVHGHCRGADRIADSIAVELGIQVIRVPALWKSYGRSAGPRRNGTIAALFEFDETLFFPLQHSVGTYDMENRAKIRVPLDLFSKSLFTDEDVS